MSKDWQKKALELREEGYSNRAIGRKLGKDESVVRRYFKRLGETFTVGVMGTPVYWDTKLGDFTTDGITNWNPHAAQLEMINKDHGFTIYGGASISKAEPMKIKPLRFEVAPTTGAKVLFLDLEVSASVVAAFSMFKHFSTPDHIIQFPYILSFACNWLHEPEDKIYAVHLADFEGFEEDHKSDKELVMRLWQFMEEADIIVIQNEGFDRGWFSQRCAYWDLPEPSPYRVCCTLKGLKKAMSLPSNSLGYSTKYFNLGHQKLSHDGISLWIRCMNGEVEALDLMKEYNVGDIPTLRQLYLKIRPWIPNHPNVALYYGDKDGKKRCSVCGSTHLTELESKAYTNLSVFTAYRCNDCGTVKRDGEREKGSSKHYLRTISK